MQNRVEITATTEHNKMRLEDFLLDHFSSLSKMYLRELVKLDRCEVNGRAENIGFRLRHNDFVEIDVDMERGTSMRPENITLDIIFEDDQLIVVSKPAGMLAHPSHRENSGTLLNALVYHFNRGSEPPAVAGGLTGSIDSPSNAQANVRSEPPAVAGGLTASIKNSGSNIHPPATAGGSDRTVRPGLIHRLDKQTSGLMVVAKTPRAHRILSGHFMKKRVEKRYMALVDGIVKENDGVIEAPIGRFDELKYWSVKADGKHSETRFRVVERRSNTTLLELEPVTGRTNQLRIHCELIGHPIVGDTRRGGREFERLCLHAYKLAFPNPGGGEMLRFEIGLPAGFRE